MFAIVDRLSTELDQRFTAIKLSACDTVYPISQNFLNFEAMAPLAQQFSYLAISTDSLKAQVFVVKEMVKNLGKFIVLTTPVDVLQLPHPHGECLSRYLWIHPASDYTPCVVNSG